MRNIFLVFRRDYMSYVSAWGFWLGMAAMPLLILMGGWAASSTTVRYYAVIESSPVYGPAIEESFVRENEEIAEAIGEFTERAGLDAGYARGYWASAKLTVLTVASLYLLQSLFLMMAALFNIGAKRSMLTG